MKKVTDSQKEIKSTVGRYIRLDIVTDFSQYSFHEKLAILQNTPKDKIKERKIGANLVKYVPHQYARKCMNFLFNFNISQEIKEFKLTPFVAEIDNWEWDDNLKRKVKRGKKKVDGVEAIAIIRFTLGDGNIRDVFTTHKLYSNIATCDGDALKGAESKSWTLLAKSYGIGDDLKEDEETMIDRQYAKKWEEELEAEAVEIVEESPQTEEKPEQHQTVSIPDFGTTPY